MNNPTSFPTHKNDCHERENGAAIDVDAPDMPDAGVVEVRDDDEEILEEEKSHPVSR